MDRQRIIDEIVRTATENGGKPLGVRRFEADTGIKPAHWMKHWPRFGDAQKAAGFEPNSKTDAYPEATLLHAVASLSRSLGRFPTQGDLRVAEHSIAGFPSIRTLDKRLGNKAELMARVRDYCTDRPEFGDVVAWCQPPVLARSDTPPTANADSDGFVYLIKSGHYYKIGMTNSLGRREREPAIQLPDKTKAVHYIKTDDPEGIERYWHQRFALKRKNGEWFDLDVSDVQAFRRRKFM